MKKRAKKIIGTMVIMAALICLACPAAFASTSVDIYTGSTFIDNLTTSELNSLDTLDENGNPIVHYYSSHKCNGTFVPDYSASGPDLLDALLQAFYNYDSNTTIVDESSLLAAYSKIEFKDTVSPTYTSGQVSLYNVLHGNRYNSAKAIVEQNVPAILATSGDNNCIRNFHGQQSWDENTVEDWVKDLDRIVLSN